MTIDIQRDVAERFKSDTADHTMTVLHDDGLYRHLRCMQPGRSAYWFEVITWPGSLAIRGDVGESYVFSRIEDMFQFFRSDRGRINPHYWSEKLADCGRSVKDYSADVLRETLEPYLAEYEQDDYPDLLAEYRKAKADFDSLTYVQRLQRGNTAEPVEPKTPAELRALIAGYDTAGDLAHEEGARDLLRELEGFRLVSDTWEWSLSDWSWQFLWCCHAIVWAVAQYDAAKPAIEKAEVAR